MYRISHIILSYYYTKTLVLAGKLSTNQQLYSRRIGGGKKRRKAHSFCAGVIMGNYSFDMFWGSVWASSLVR